MFGYVTYVDQDLLYKTATGIIGSEVALKRSSAIATGINFKVIFQTSRGDEVASITKTSELLPEVVLEALYEAAPNKASTLDDCWKRMFPGADDNFRPGAALLLEDATIVDTNLNESAENVILGGELCRAAEISSGKHTMRIFVAEHQVSLLADFYHQPVSVLGILRYIKSYPVKGASNLNLGLRLIAVWLQ